MPLIEAYKQSLAPPFGSVTERPYLQLLKIERGSVWQTAINKGNARASGSVCPVGRPMWHSKAGVVR